MNGPGHTPIERCLRRLSANQSSDGQLLRQFVDLGDQDAFALLVRRHGGLVLGVCQRVLGHAQDAEDAAQAAFLVLARKAAAVAWNESVAGWLHEVAVRVAHEARRSVARRRAREQTVPALPEPAHRPENGDSELAEVLDWELSQLPEKLRGPLVLCYLKGLTRDEAAEQLGWKLSQMKTRLEQGRNILRDRLARRGLTLGAVLAAALVTHSAQAALPASFAANVVLTAQTPGTGSAAAVELASAVMRSMWLARVKKIALASTAVLLCVVGGGILAQSSIAPPPPNPIVARDDRADIVAPVKEVKGPLTMKHGDPVRDANFSPDGKQVIVAAMDGTFRRWDAFTGKELGRWPVKGLNSAVAISRDGKRVAGGNNLGELVLWHTDDAAEDVRRQTRQGNVFSLTFTHDGKQVVSANHVGTLSYWDAVTGANIQHVAAHEGRAWVVALSPDGNTLASGGADGKVRLWDPRTGDHLRDLEGHAGNVCSVSFSTDGRRVVSADMEDSFSKFRPDPAGDKDSIRIWDFASGAEVSRITTPLPHFAALSPDGSVLASGDRKGRVHLWNTVDGCKITSWQAHEGPAMCGRFDADGGRLLTAGQDGAVHLWNVSKK